MIQLNWQMADDGLITQAITDMHDWRLSIFHEAAKAHNQAHYDKEPK